MDSTYSRIALSWAVIRGVDCIPPIVASCDRIVESLGKVVGGGSQVLVTDAVIGHQAVGTCYVMWLCYFLLLQSSKASNSSPSSSSKSRDNYAGAM